MAETTSGVRVLVGTRKGAFILTSDGKRQKWDVSGPHFAGWELYHVKGSPADPDCIYASQASSWFGQVMQHHPVILVQKFNCRIFNIFKIYIHIIMNIGVNQVSVFIKNFIMS